MDDEGFVDAVLSDTREKMTRATDHTRDELAGLRTGRAVPALVEKLRVEYYGSEVPLQQVAGIQVPEAKLMVITPYDKGSLADIERARGQLLQRCGPVACVKSTGHGRFLPPFPLVIHGMCRDRPVRLGARDVAHCRREVDARRVVGPPRDVLIGPHQQELLPGVVRGRRDHGEGDRQRTGPF